jgi:hypothetical protein
VIVEDVEPETLELVVGSPQPAPTHQPERT